MDQNGVTSTGFVAEIDGLIARVLVGTPEEEWCFPVTTLPEGVRVGDGVTFVRRGARFVALGFARANARAVDRSIEDRLARPLARHRSRRTDVPGGAVAAAG